MPTHIRKRTRRQRKQTRRHRTKTQSKKQRGGNETESKIGSEILQLVKDIQSDQKQRSFHLEFTFKNTPYTTDFIITYETLGKRSYNIRITNECIELNIELYTHKNSNKVYSFIHRNDREPACFTPRLETTDTPVRITSVDVLQSLSTKLKLLLHRAGYIPYVKVIDDAQLKSVPLFPYRILRGVPALYEKYGYGSDELDKFRTTVLPKVTWKYIVSVDKDNMLRNPIYLSILEKYNKHRFEDDFKLHPIRELLVNVPMEEEMKHGISSTLMAIVSDSDEMTEFVLDPESAKWKEWDTALQFVRFTGL